MNTATLQTLFVETIRTPALASRRIIDMQIPAQVLWLALATVSVVTSVILSGVMHAVLAMPDLPLELRSYFESMPGAGSPLLFALLRLFQAGLLIVAMFWVGRWLAGGQGAIEDVLAPMTLLQIVSFALLILLTLIGTVLPSLSIFGFAAFIFWLIWAAATMLDAAFRFENLAKAIGLLVLSFVGMMIAFTVIVTLLLPASGGTLGGT